MCKQICGGDVMIAYLTAEARTACLDTVDNMLEWCRGGIMKLGQ